MRIADLFEAKNGSSEVRAMMADAIRFARSVNVQMLLRYHPDRRLVEITDFNAKNPGTGGGTKALSHICELSDEHKIDLLILPSSARNKAFYQRFGFERSSMGSGLLIRWPAYDPDDLDEDTQVVTMDLGR